MSKIAIDALLEKTSSTKPVLKTIEFVSTEGEAYEADVWVRKMQFSDSANLTDVYTIQSVDADGKPTYKEDTNKLQAARIFSCVCKDEDGNALFHSVEQVLEMDNDLATALFIACDEVNNFLGKYLKLATTMSSGASSLSEASAEKPSKKPKKTSRKQKSTRGKRTEKSTAASASADA